MSIAHVVLWVAGAAGAYKIIQWLTDEEFKRTEYPKKFRKELVAAHWRENGGLCTDCGVIVRKKNLSVDHIVSIRRGGKNSRNNARVICLPCNSRKGERQGALDEFIGCGGARPRRRRRA